MEFAVYALNFSGIPGHSVEWQEQFHESDRKLDRVLFTINLQDGTKHTYSLLKKEIAQLNNPFLQERAAYSMIFEVMCCASKPFWKYGKEQGYPEAQEAPPDAIGTNPRRF
jgi:hypothetical protein